MRNIFNNNLFSNDTGLTTRTYLIYIYIFEIVFLFLNYISLLGFCNTCILFPPLPRYGGYLPLTSSSHLSPPAHQHTQRTRTHTHIHKRTNTPTHHTPSGCWDVCLEKNVFQNQPTDTSANTRTHTHTHTHTDTQRTQHAASCFFLF